MKNKLFAFLKCVHIVFVSFILSFSVSAKEVPKLKELLKQDDIIWGFDFINEEDLLLTLRSGSLLHFNLKTKKLNTIKGTPELWVKGQGGLLDVRIHPTNKKLVYLSFSEPKAKGGTTSLASGELKGDQLINLKILFSSGAVTEETIHFGSRIEFDGDGHLFLSIGDRNERKEVQKLSTHFGKLIRLNLDGSVPTDNPFVGSKDKRPEIWSYGHRSPQGLSYHNESKTLYLSEMGPRGGDEINQIRKAANYGWPEVTYGSEYWGPSIGVKTRKDVKGPFVYWVPSISPSAIHFYTGDKYPAWKGDLFVACLSGMQIRRLKIKDGKVFEEVSLLSELKERFRNLRTGPDGFLYVSTDNGILGRIELN